MSIHRPRQPCAASRARASWTYPAFLVGTALAFGLGACLVQGEPDSTVARITLALGGVAKGGSVAPADAVDLAERPCYVAASVTAPDLPAPATSAWACDPGEQPGGTAELVLELPAGADRSLRIVAFLVEQDGLHTFAATSRHDWPSGEVELDVDATEVATGDVDAFVTGAERDVISARLVDLDSGVLLPSVPAIPLEGGFHFTISRVPQGRFFGLELELAGGARHEVLDCAVWATPGSVRVVSVDVAEDRC